RLGLDPGHRVLAAERDVAADSADAVVGGRGLTGPVDGPADPGVARLRARAAATPRRPAPAASRAGPAAAPAACCPARRPRARRARWRARDRARPRSRPPAAGAARDSVPPRPAPAPCRTR